MRTDATATSSSWDEWTTDQLDLDAYLNRIGHTGPRTADAATLAALHRAHVAAIPFENLDVILGRGISVALPDVQRKLVEARRGGYCYEHGLLFAAVATRLGFTAQRLLARVGDLERPRPRTHLVTVLTDPGGEAWLADPGFGVRPAHPAAPARRRRGHTGRLDLPAPPPRRRPVAAAGGRGGGGLAAAVRLRDRRLPRGRRRDVEPLHLHLAGLAVRPATRGRPQGRARGTPTRR